MEHFSGILNGDTEISHNTVCSCCGEGLRMRDSGQLRRGGLSEIFGMRQSPRWMGRRV